MEWNPEIVRRVRGAMQDRARAQACLYQTFSEELSPEETEKLARKAIAQYGTIRAERDGHKLTPDEWVDEHYTMMGGVFETQITKNDEYSEMRMHYCPLLEEWKKMGLSAQEQDLHCDIAMELDRNRAKEHGIKCDIEERLGKGDSFCRVVLWKNKKA